MKKRIKKSTPEVSKGIAVKQVEAPHSTQKEAVQEDSKVKFNKSAK